MKIHGDFFMRVCTVLAHRDPPQYDGDEALPVGMRYPRA